MESAADRTTEAASEAAGAAYRAGGRTMERGAHIAGEAAQRGMEAAGEGAREFIESTAGQVGDMGQRMARAAEQTTEDLRTLMTIPVFGGAGFGSGMQEMQHAMTNMMNRLAQINLRASQEVFRVASLGVLVEMQQRFVHHYVDGLMEGSAEFLRASRQLAEEGLRPLENRLQQKIRQHGASRFAGGRYRSSGREENSAGKVADVMTVGAETARPEQTVQEAAQRMAEEDIGALPVEENDRLVGIITDRDIAVRVTAEGKDPKQTQVREAMTSGVRYCYDDEDVEHVAQNMADQQIRRLMVMNRDKRLVGTVSLGDIASAQPHIAGAALHGIAQNGHQRQRAHAGDKPQRGENSRR
jgi:CBS domain-containing protein